MSVKIAAFKNPPPGAEYACSVLEVKEWAKGLADLRVEFGTDRVFRFSPRCVNRPKLQGSVVASMAVDRQLKPSLFFYALPGSQYPGPARQEFSAGVLGQLRKWLDGQLVKSGEAMVGQEMVVVELVGGRFKIHYLRYL